MARMRVGQRRTGLVDAALRVMNDKGVAAATTRAIVAEADMSLASFHYAYTSREEMMGEAIRAVIDAEHPVDVEVSAGTSAANAIERLLNVYLDRLIANPGHRSAMVELNQYAIRLPALEELATQQYAAYRAAVKQSLAALTERLDLHWSIGTDATSRLLLGILDGISLQWLADRDTVAARDALRAASQAITDQLGTKG